MKEINSRLAAGAFIYIFRGHNVIKAAEIAGFTFGVKNIEQYNQGFHGHFDFKCVCGREEALQFFIKERTAESVVEAANHYARLFGEVEAFSVVHLLEDGYTESEANEIHRKYTCALGRLE